MTVAAGWVRAWTPERQPLTLADERVKAALRETLRRDPVVASIEDTQYVSTFLVVTHGPDGLRLLHEREITVLIVSTGTDNEIVSIPLAVKLEIS